MISLKADTKSERALRLSKETNGKVLSRTFVPKRTITYWFGEGNWSGAEENPLKGHSATFVSQLSFDSKAIQTRTAGATSPIQMVMEIEMRVEMEMKMESLGLEALEKLRHHKL